MTEQTKEGIWRIEPYGFICNGCGKLILEEADDAEIEVDRNKTVAFFYHASCLKQIRKIERELRKELQS